MAQEPRTGSMKKYKLIILGNPNVGKTTLTYRLCEGKFLDSVEPTIGVDLRSCVINVEGEDIKLEIWDTAGQERFRRSLISAYYRNADAIVFVYDVTDLKSFNDLKVWLEESARNELVRAPKIVIGNKCDQPAVVNRSVAQRFADANGMLLFETSSSSESNCDHVNAIFYAVAHQLRKRRPLAGICQDNDVITTERLRSRIASTDCDNQSSSCFCGLF